MLDLDQIRSKMTGCGDGNCVFGHPGGMQTNGGCKCLPTNRISQEERFAIRTKVIVLREDRKALITECERLQELVELLQSNDE